jgi:hypothetical protein
MPLTFDQAADLVDELRALCRVGNALAAVSFRALERQAIFTAIDDRKRWLEGILRCCVDASVRDQVQEYADGERTRPAPAVDTTRLAASPTRTVH